MAKPLNITNGDSAVEVMKLARIPGDHLPWRDVLRDGPVPKALALDELSSVRTEYNSGRVWDEIAGKIRHGLSTVHAAQ